MKERKVFEDAVKKVNTGNRVQWLSENEFEVLRNPMISRLYEHTAENNEHKIEKRYYSAGTKGGEQAQVAQSGRSSLRTALAKQAMVMFVIAVMLTAPNDTMATGPPTTVRQAARTRLRAVQLTSMGEWWWRRPGQDIWRYETECRPTWADQEQKW